VHRKPFVLVIALPVLLGVAGFGVKHWSNDARPIVQAPDLIDLGVKSAGTYVNIEVPVRNAGSLPLELTNFRASCGACTTLFEGAGGNERPLGRSLVLAGEVFSVRVRLMIAGKPDAKLNRYIEFSTNDPASALVRVNFSCRVEGGLTALPESIDVGFSRREQTSDRMIEIRDTGLRVPQPLARAEASNAEIGRVLSFTPCNDPVEPGDPSLGRVIGRAKIAVVAPKSIGGTEGEIRFYGSVPSAAPVLVVPLRSRLHSPVEVSPAAVVLPYVTANTDVYSMNCCCRSSDGRPFELSTESNPVGLSVRIQGDRGVPKVVHLVTIEWLADKLPRQVKVETKVVRLVAKFDNGTEAIDVPVHCRRPD
jgi:hypothetical protein